MQGWDLRAKGVQAELGAQAAPTKLVRLLLLLLLGCCVCVTLPSMQAGDAAGPGAASDCLLQYL